MSVTCNYCGRPAKLVTGATIYPRREDLGTLNFWSCAPCGAYVGCHKPGNGYGDGTTPLGRLANAELRSAKNKAHAALDPMWQEAGLSRSTVYGWLAKEMELPMERCHIGEFDVEQCAEVVRLCKSPKALVFVMTTKNAAVSPSGSSRHRSRQQRP